MQPSLSIIIPVYNVSKYLEECLLSVLNQTIRDIEIICINDGSTDDSLGILLRYASIDKRIMVINKKNEWLGKAYNVWLDIAHGKYIGFVEPDDFVDYSMYEKLFNHIEKGTTDVVRCNFYQVYWWGNKKIHVPQFWLKKIFTPYPVNPLQYPDIFLGHSAHWSCLYRRDMLESNTIRFMETAWASFQDAPFWFQTLGAINSISFVSEPLYYYRIHSEQSNNKGKPYFWKNMFSCIDIYLEKLSLQKSKKYQVLLFVRLRKSIIDYTWWLACMDYRGQSELGADIRMDYGDGRFDTIAKKLPILEKILYYLLRNWWAFGLYICLQIKNKLFRM